ncbi:hypothetical protein OSB04_024725 [Centaurea solstitialis]|uniref:Uncharacterized protein n=1 Tax=Centaurea solstitialis TaxID=347529 RepID=A0AA38T652_9ASTR|nr:hypothetical protein OSB04_024725 [Centaurea solstitialis]
MATGNKIGPYHHSGEDTDLNTYRGMIWLHRLFLDMDSVAPTFFGRPGLGHVSRSHRGGYTLKFSNLDISKYVSAGDFEASSTQVIETEIIAHKFVAEELVNVPLTTIALTNKRTGVMICLDFTNLCINIKTSLDLERREKDKEAQKQSQCSNFESQRPKIICQKKQK